MAVVFPTSLDDWTKPVSTQTLYAAQHNQKHCDTIDAIEALEAKVGVDNSSVVTSLDYLIKNTSSRLGKIASLAVTDGNFIVGNGTNWVAESGATALASLGLVAEFIKIRPKPYFRWVGFGFRKLNFNWFYCRYYQQGNERLVY